MICGFRWLAAATVVVALCGCAGTLPPHAKSQPSRTNVAPPEAPLAQVAPRVGVAPGASGVWPMPQAAIALDARLAAIAAATSSVDVQTYLLADDGVGHLVLRALADAAARGVRVRLLLDDFYTTGLDPLLLGLATYPNVEVRLFNPFVAGRDSSIGRLVALAGDFHRLDHRMHNKLFVVDGQVAIVGGRNLADDYFLKGQVGNFFDVDLLLVGGVVPSLSMAFDRYWNSEPVYDIHELAFANPSVIQGGDGPRAAFDRRVTSEVPPAPPPRDEFGGEPFSAQLATGQFQFFVVGQTSVYADPPEKMKAASADFVDTVSRRLVERLDEARKEVVLFSPYFIPESRMIERLRTLRARGVSVRIITNSLAVSDEPFANIGLERHQRELLSMGVELYELSSDRVKVDSSLRTLLGSSIGRLHAKMAIVDRHIVYIGSMNLDGRSARINTEIGIRVESPSLAAMLYRAFRIDEAVGVYRVKLLADGQTLVWSVRDEDGNEVTLADEPDASWLHRLRVRLLSAFVPEGEL